MNIWALLSKEAMKVGIKPGMLLSVHKLYSWLGGQPINPLLEALLPGRRGFGLRVLGGGTNVPLIPTGCLLLLSSLVSTSPSRRRASVL